MKTILTSILYMLYMSITSIVADVPCIVRKFDFTSVVCVCNSTYCDGIDQIKPLPRGQYVEYVSSEEGFRFNKRIGYVNSSTSTPINAESDLRIFLSYIITSEIGKVVLHVKRNKQFQTIIGWGGAATDTVTFLANQLSEGSRENLIRSYFGKFGLEYNIIRVPIGGTDFSLRPYTYNLYPRDDMKLSNFSLEKEDLELKMPFLRKAQELSTTNVYLLATAWGPPPWMKSNDHFGGPSRLRKKYYQTWADYHLRFLEEYEKLGFKFWAITPGNEPSNGIFGFDDLISLGWGMKEYVIWLGNNFGPTIRNSKFNYVKILILDDNKAYVPWAVDWIAEDEKASKYFDGISLHYYDDHFIPSDLTDVTHEAYPDKFIIMTEASFGSDNVPHPIKVALGDWSRGEWYIDNIITNLNHWYTGWMDWNLCLDRDGGPSWSTNHVDASVIINEEQDEFYKQPMFYAIGHVSKFVPRGSVRIKIKTVVGEINNVGFLRPDGGIVIIFHNPNSFQRHVIIHEKGIGTIKLAVNSNSIHTVLYW